MPKLVVKTPIHIESRKNDKKLEQTKLVAREYPILSFSKGTGKNKVEISIPYDAFTNVTVYHDPDQNRFWLLGWMTDVRAFFEAEIIWDADETEAYSLLERRSKRGDTVAKRACTEAGWLAREPHE